MPYIDEVSRSQFSANPNRPKTAGELNYLITKLCSDYLETVCTEAFTDMVKLRYSAINEVVGVLECAKLEMYRRVAAPYEDQKRFDNGDVYAKEIV